MSHHAAIRFRFRALLAPLAAMAVLWPVSSGATPSISVRAERVLLPLVGEDDLDTGWMENDPARGTFAIEVEVKASPDDDSGWALYIRSEGSGFTAGGIDKPCSDLLWKLDEAPASAFARLEQEEALVVAVPEGGSSRVALDVRVRVDWSTGSGPLGLGVLFFVAPD